MISKALIQDIKALHQPKFRQIYNKFIAEGEKVCTEFLKSSKYKIEKVFISNNALPKYQHLLKDKTAEIIQVTSKEMEQISSFKTPSDILLLLERMEIDDNILLNEDTSAIYLDGIQDPGNVGTIIRLADWFGIDAVIRSGESADFFNPKVIQSSMGSMVNVDLFSADYTKIIECGKKLYGTFMTGHDIFNTTMEQNAIIVLGSEGKGISPELSSHIDVKVTIPGNQSKVAESLNVAVAAGILCSVWKGKNI